MDLNPLRIKMFNFNPYTFGHLDIYTFSHLQRQARQCLTSLVKRPPTLREGRRAVSQRVGDGVAYCASSPSG